MSYKTHNKPGGSRHVPAGLEGIVALEEHKAACRRGDHTEAVAKEGRVTYLGGTRIEPGTRYCLYCTKLL